MDDNQVEGFTALRGGFAGPLMMNDVSPSVRIAILADIPMTDVISFGITRPSWLTSAPMPSGAYVPSTLTCNPSLSMFGPPTLKPLQSSGQAQALHDRTFVLDGFE